MKKEPPRGAGDYYYYVDLSKKNLASEKDSIKEAALNISIKPATFRPDKKMGIDISFKRKIVL